MVGDILRNCGKRATTTTTYNFSAFIYNKMCIKLLRNAVCLFVVGIVMAVVVLLRLRFIFPVLANGDKDAVFSFIADVANISICFLWRTSNGTFTLRLLPE